MMRTLVLFLFIVWMLTTPCHAEDLPKSELIKLTAARMVADERQQTVSFSGKVVAVQADMTVYADKMVMTYAAEPGQVESIDIEGGLRIVQGERIATADRGVFEQDERRILLFGNAEVHQGGNRIDGDEIVYYLDEARSVVKSRPDSRVKAVFSSGGEKE